MKSDLRITVETASGHPREDRTAAELRQLLDDYELAGLQWTDRVVVQFMARAHSHPVLTLNTRVTGTRLLGTYVHEQVHWWVADHPGTGAAIEESKTHWPEVPGDDEGGSGSEFSTRLHLIVCHLEHRAMEQLVGDLSAESLLEEQIHGSPSYPWIRAQVRDHAAVLDRMCSAHNLWPDRLSGNTPSVAGLPTGIGRNLTGPDDVQLPGPANCLSRSIAALTWVRKRLTADCTDGSAA